MRPDSVLSNTLLGDAVYAAGLFGALATVVKHFPVLVNRLLPVGVNH